MGDGDLPARASMHELPASSGAVSRRLLASWRRSEDYGVSLEAVDPAFRGGAEHDSLFSECGREVLGQLQATLAAEPVSLVLTDSDGLILDRRSGDRGLLEALDAVYLAPGFTFSERETGTNGMGLALADRAPTLVRAEEHYCAGLYGFTCAAVPVLDPFSGQLAGSVNLSTWSRSSSDLLLALAQSAASNTSALMLARSTGRVPRPAPRGEVFRVEPARLVDDAGSLATLSTAWSAALTQAAEAMALGKVVAAVGEPGAGRSTLLALAHRRVHPRDRILSASPPDPRDVDSWLALWTPELAKRDTGVVVRGIDDLPSWAAGRLREIFDGVRREPGTQRGPDGREHPVSQSFALTAEDLARVPRALRELVDSVVEVPPLRERADDVEPLARHFAREARGHELGFTPAALRALRACAWPGNVAQLRQVVRDVAARGDVIDVRQLPPEVLSGPSHRLTRVEAFERQEILRCLLEPGATVTRAAAVLGMSRATIYRKIAHYGISVPGRGA